MVKPRQPETAEAHYDDEENPPGDSDSEEATDGRCPKILLVGS